MKRSEAVDLIKQEIEKALVKYGSSGTGFLVSASHNILAELLEAGMLPPTSIVEIDDHHEICPDGILTIEFGDEYINEWDKENE